MKPHEIEDWVDAAHMTSNWYKLLCVRLLSLSTPNAELIALQREPSARRRLWSRQRAEGSLNFKLLKDYDAEESHAKYRPGRATPMNYARAVVCDRA
jgi:hypothetical protein